ncbi:MAG: molecular chaperone DnaJ [Chlamydiae bacterium CG10_big_fil_rev_8_21_14_0_10_42_34]|nr:MAG: molecular chaperone DnaJ [Chlamydiae bacterium CG10_big_fil_rev_8_21_14_0_10_42_34]
MAKDFYATLGLSRDASPEEIKKAYRKKALEHHPDRNQGNPKAEAQFKLVSEAYEVLSDENRRRVYDQYGEEGLSGAGMGGGGGGGFPGGFSSMEEALRTFMGAFGGRSGGGESVFDSFFGGGGGYEEESAARKGASKKATVRVTFEEAARGTEKELAILNYVTCEPCSGSGAKSRNGIKTCSTCQGKGQVYQSRGFFSMSSACPHCGGAGQVITDPCKTCGGAGRTKEKQRIKARIPAGVDSGMRLKMSGYGDAGEAGGPPGDLYVYIEVEKHEAFTREGDDVYLELPITFTEAALGAKKEIPTPLNEQVRIQIPEGTQNGKLLRVNGKGFPNVHGQGHGDLLVRVLVETPVRLSEKQKELLRSFEGLESPQNHPRKKTFLEKLKVFFSD